MTVSQVNLWADRVMYYSLLPLAFFLPISTAVLEIAATFCISAFFIKRIIIFFLNIKNLGFRKTLATIKPVSHPLVFPVTLFIFATLLSVIASQFPFQSWKGFFGKTVQAVMLFFAIVETFNTRKRINLFFSIFVFSICIVSFDGIWQYFLKKDFFFFRDITFEGRVTGTFEHPNDYGGYLLVVASFLVGLLVWAWETRREKIAQPDFFIQGKARFMLFLVGAVMAVISLGWTFSRGAWIGFACATMVLLFLQAKKWYIPFTFLLIFWVVFSSQLGTVRNVSFVTDDISMDGRYRVKRLAAQVHEVKKSEFTLYMEDILSALSRFNWTGRQVFWLETIEVFKAAPVFGTGLNTYTKAVQRYNKPWSGYYSHNCYLQMLAEIGIVGLMSFLWIMFVLTRETWRAFQKMPNGFYRVVLAGLFSGLFGFWVHGALDTNFYSARLGNMMWIIMGFIVAVILTARQDTGSDTPT